MPDDIVQKPSATGTAPAAAKPAAAVPPAATQPAVKAKKAAEAEPSASVTVAHSALQSLVRQFEGMITADSHRHREVLASAAIDEINALLK